MNTKTYSVTISLTYEDMTVDMDIPVEYTSGDKAIFDYIMSNIEVDWDEING